MSDFNDSDLLRNLGAWTETNTTPLTAETLESAFNAILNMPPPKPDPEVLVGEERERVARLFGDPDGSDPFVRYLHSRYMARYFRIDEAAIVEMEHEAFGGSDARS